MAVQRLTAEELASLSDGALLAQARASLEPAIRELTRRYNRRLFRVCFSILRDHADAEEAVQDAYLKAFTGRAPFDGAASVGTWIIRIAINESLDRRRATQRRVQLLAQQGIAEMSDYRARLAEAPVSHGSPEQSVARRQVARQLEQAIYKLPVSYRTVFILRDIEGLNIEDAAVALSVAPQTIKTRLHRARLMLQQTLQPELDSVLQDTFPFGGDRCAAMTERVLGNITPRTEGDTP